MKFHHIVVAGSLAVLAWLLSSFANEGKAPAPAPKRADPAVFVLHDVRVFDGERTWPKASVLVRDGRVEAIAAQVVVPGGAHVIDGKGRTLLPGLIDAHTHTWGTARRDALRFGVTTELDMFTDWRQLAKAREERNSLAATDHADLWSAGTLATVAGGHGTEFGMPIPTLSSRATRAIVAIWKNGHRVDRSLDAGASMAAAPAGPVSDFDGTALNAARGMKWMPTSDRMMGGASSSALSRIAGGAQESAGAMRIRGAISPGSAWPWAGAMLNLGTVTFEPVNASRWKEVVFQARGDGREYTLMLFSGVEQQAPPSMLRFRPGRDWTTVRLPLAGFAGADLARLRAVEVMAGMPEGEFQLDVDSVEIR
jgi:hypothetical protein